LRCHAARETLGRRQRDASDMVLVKLREYLNDDLLVPARSQHSVDVRQVALKPSINHASSYCHDNAIDCLRVIQVSVHKIVCTGSRSLAFYVGGSILFLGGLFLLWADAIRTAAVALEPALKFKGTLSEQVSA
jgi:hypothetical protein